MKILYIAPRYYPHVGGVEYVIKSIAERLASKGHDVIVLAGESDAEKTVEEEINRVHVIRWPTWSPGNAYHLPRKRSELAKLLKEIARNLDVVHVHSIHSVLSVYCLNFIDKETKRKNNLKMVLTPYYHGTGHTFFRRVLWIPWRIYVKHAVQTYVDAIHTVSRLEAELMEKHFGIHAVPIENGVDEWLLNISWSPSNYVMYSGRIEMYKNIHRLGNIVKILNNKFRLDLELKIFGDDPFVSSLDDYLKRLRINYEILPTQPFEKYIEYLSHATFLGLLSEKESYPQSVNEAHAIGVPTVIAKPWGLNFAERHRNLIVDLKLSDEEIADQIVKFLELATKMPKSKVPTWSEVALKYLDLYKSILAEI